MIETLGWYFLTLLLGAFCGWAVSAIQELQHRADRLWEEVQILRKQVREMQVEESP